MGLSNYPDGMSSSDWLHVNGLDFEEPLEDEECPRCGTVGYLMREGYRRETRLFCTAPAGTVPHIPGNDPGDPLEADCDYDSGWDTDDPYDG